MNLKCLHACPRIPRMTFIHVIRLYSIKKNFKLFNLFTFFTQNLIQNILSQFSSILFPTRLHLFFLFLPLITRLPQTAQSQYQSQPFQNTNNLSRTTQQLKPPTLFPPITFLMTKPKHPTKELPCETTRKTPTNNTTNNTPQQHPATTPHQQHLPSTLSNNIPPTTTPKKTPPTTPH